MIDLARYEVWFVPGSQTLYGEETLTKVAEHSRQIANELSNSPEIPVKVVCRPVMKDAASIQELCMEANRAANCIGIITWMHTFSPAKMWIPGSNLCASRSSICTRSSIASFRGPTIDMDFMNLNQSAHGDREFGFITSRLRFRAKLLQVFGKTRTCGSRLRRWTRAACAWHDSQNLKVARFGDNMRQVAVTEGDKVEARIKLGYSVEGYGVGDLVDRIQQVTASDVDALVTEYEASYTLAESLQAGKKKRDALRDAARTEIGLRRFLDEGRFGAFTDTFEDLHGLSQLPGIGVQRLMADGFGFGAEGDWKTAALVRAMKVMSAGLEGGTSFMEDYTYHFENGGQVLGAHMLEVCPSIAAAKPSLEIHPLSIGGKEDPVRLVFDSQTGPAVVASIVDMGDRFRLVVNKVHVVPTEEPLPKLPVAQGSVASRA